MKDATSNKNTEKKLSQQIRKFKTSSQPKKDETQTTKRSMVKNFKRHIQFTLNAENTNSNSNFKSHAIKIF